MFRIRVFLFESVYLEYDVISLQGIFKLTIRAMVDKETRERGVKRRFTSSEQKKEEHRDKSPASQYYD